MTEVDPQKLLNNKVNDSSDRDSFIQEKTGGAAEEEERMKLEFYGDKRNKSPEMDQTAMTPMSPGKKLLYYAGSPGRYIKLQIRPGSVKSSIFSLVIICLGAGTLTIPYTFYELGFVGGLIAITFGGVISVFAGWMLAHACAKTNATCFEEIAMVSFGKRAQIMTSVCMILCNAGFLISYQVLVSNSTHTDSHFSSNPLCPIPYKLPQVYNYPLGVMTPSLVKYFGP
jgi:hypothetical protein